MNTNIVLIKQSHEVPADLRRLLKIERSIDGVDAFSLRQAVMEMQEFPLQCENSSLDALRLEKAQSTRFLKVFEIARW